MKGYLLLALILIGAVLILLIFVREKAMNKKVISSSKKISELLKLNQTIAFHDLETSFSVVKHYDNKSNYNKIEPAFLMTAELKNNLEYYSQYSNCVNENKKKLLQYESQVQTILATDFPIDYAGLKLKESAYKRRENKLFSKNLIQPVTDCTFAVTMTYSSPKGKVNLSKSDTFDFNDFYACLESISRSRLDKKTYLALANVERGEVSDSLRYDILRRDNFTCVICGASARQGARLHVDHIIPIAKGGKSIPSNLRTLCERCNIGKSDKTESITSDTIAENNGVEQEPVCSWCGAKLILRKGKYGEFYGCSNFPNCKFTKNVN